MAGGQRANYSDSVFSAFSAACERLRLGVTEDKLGTRRRRLPYNDVVRVSELRKNWLSSMGRAFGRRAQCQDGFSQVVCGSAAVPAVRVRRAGLLGIHWCNWLI